MKAPSNNEVLEVDSKELEETLDIKNAPVMMPAIMVGAYVDRGENMNFPELGEICTIELVLQVKGVDNLAIMPVVCDLELAEALGLKDTTTGEEE
jgi:hypothetical protein